MLGLWLAQRFAASNHPNQSIPAADAAKPGDTGNANKTQANCSQRRSDSCSARKVAPRLLVDGRKQNRQAFNNHLTRPTYCGWLRAACNCFPRVLVCKLFTEKPKEGRNRSHAHNLSQPPNPRPTRPLASYSSPVATAFSGYEIQSLQLPAYNRTLLNPASCSAITFGVAVTPEPQ